MITSFLCIKAGLINNNFICGDELVLARKIMFANSGRTIQ